MFGNKLVQTFQIVAFEGCVAVTSWQWICSSRLPVARKPALERPDIHIEHPGDIRLGSLLRIVRMNRTLTYICRCYAHE